ncbi:hypothetical protein [Nocardiopsis sp. FR4]|uniref:hypothetical protein n=1 Tax=Nocardiopsis sp. FR4 TaxID=2605985 RepID=UPI001356E516|nr:hypothetical protein [Nocardiopsis sp. FR4]
MGTGDPRERKARALAEERQRLARIRQERARARGDDVWREFQVEPDRISDLRDAVEAAIVAAGAAGGDTAERLSVLLNGRPCPEAPSLLLRLLGRLPSRLGALHLARLHEIGVRQTAESGYVAALISGRVEPTAETLLKVRCPTPPLLLWRDSELVRLGSAPTDPERFLSTAPLALVDDFLGREPAVSPTGQERTDARENLYLLARSDPDRLTGEQAEALDWPEELWRRRLREDPGLPVPDEAPESARILAGVADGDPVAAELLVGSLAGRAENLLRDLLDNRGRPAAWPRAVFADRSFWPLLEDLCGSATLPRSAPAPMSEFVAWRDLRRAHRDLMNVDPRTYKALSPHLASRTAWVREEATAMEVYLNLRFADPGDSQALRNAWVRLAALKSDSPVVAANIAWLMSLLDTDRNHRGPLFNPYLELGVPHGVAAGEWKAAWRGLRRELKGRTEELSDINHARDLLRDIEADGGPENHPLYVLPVHREELFPAPRVPAPLIPGARPLPRRTESLPPSERERIRDEAMASLMELAVRERTP